ncbi:GlyGly-CTERM sorting domain-containing protein [Phyllobacterium endophyticum]|nr:GlyGly-CTERM sorting domain-containing protein [Phyllobacterium endophyticum]
MFFWSLALALGMAWRKCR